MTVTSSIGSGAVVEPNALLTDGTQLIGGEWGPAASGETIDVINPATGELLLRVPRSGSADVDAAVRAAADAFPAWRDTSPVMRADLLRRWAALCRERTRDIEILIPLHVELGGKAPQIVLPDADLSRAIPVIVGSITLNTGQVCAAGSRVLVASSQRAELVDLLAALFSSVRVGPWYEDVQMGPLISARQEQRVLGYLDIGRAEGAEVVTGGHKLAGSKYDRGFFVEPTLFDRVTPDMRIAQEEIFGPVLSVLSYSSEDEAVQIANGVRYGLNACVWTSDVGRAVRLARRIEAGQVTINGFGSRGVIGAPWGGYKHSGFGRTMSAESMLDYTQVKTVVINA